MDAGNKKDVGNEKTEPDYKSLYIDALQGLETAQKIINKTIRDCKSRVGGDWYLEWLQTDRIVTHGGKDVTEEGIKRYQQAKESNDPGPEVLTLD